MTFLDNLKDIEPLNFNNSFISGSEPQVVNNIITNANTTTGGLWFTISILILFIILLWVFSDREKAFLFDLPRTMLISSGWCLVISIVAVLSTFSITIAPIIWFSGILFISFIAVSLRKEGNR